MKTVKYLLSAVLLITAVWSCTEDEFGSIDFVSTATAPTNVSALFDVTQDNTGTVTITPVGEGAASYDVSFGDGAAADATAKSGESLTHIYPEGSFDVQLAAYGVTGLKTEATVPLVVSFKAPENLAVEISNDEAISKQVNVTATADFAVSFDVFFGESGNDTPVSGNIGSTVSYVYQEAGTYTIRLVAKGAAIATTEHTEEFEVTAIMQPLNSAPTPPGREAADVVSIFGTAYDNVSNANYFPDWGQAGQGSSWAMFDLNSDEMLQYINLSYQGVQFDAVDVSNMEYFHMDVWTADLDKIETSLISLTNGEKPVVSDLTADEWTSIDIPVADWTSQGLTVADLFQLKFVGDPWAGGSVFIDNIYFWKTPAAPSELIGTWQLAPQGDALGVGPAPGDLSWWSIGDQGLIDRACYVDDTYVFGADGSFSNVLGADTWIESWQGTEGCGAPVAPHDGSNSATFSNDETTITIAGLGAYLGLPKAHNTGEDGAPVNNTIVYNYTLSNDKNTLDVSIEVGSGVWWNYKFVRKVSPIAGTWKLASQGDALGVGPAPGDLSWWSIGDQGLIDRACYVDDNYVFGSDGSFSNVLGADTWIESWQGTEGCGAPVAPHDGTNPATWTNDDTTITISGLGAYLGLPKAHNTGEDGAPVNNTIVYNYTLSNNNDTLDVSIEAGSGVWWNYKFVRN